MKIITLCGSMKFKKEMMEVAERMALDGNCILTPVYYTQNNIERTETQLERLKKEHFRKIELSDAIFVVNKNNYIGQSTNLEIEYAKRLGKEIMYLELEEKDNNLTKNENIKFNSLIPELSVSNIDISQKFYMDLGFQVKYERKEDKFCFLQLEENQIMIEENNNNWNTGNLEYPYGRGINISMTVLDVEKMYNKLKEKDSKFFLNLEIHEYRVNDKVSLDKEFLIQDPDGYLLRFNN